jgi:cardiolipin synthase
MLHAKTAVADGRWARVGSSNLNLASWTQNCEIDVTIEDEAFAHRMQDQYEADLLGATEIVLFQGRRVPRAPRPRAAHGSGSGEAAAGALRLANTVGAAITNRRLLAPGERGILLGASLLLFGSAALAFYFPRLLAWPLALLAAWSALALFLRYLSAAKHARAARAASEYESRVRAQ